MHSKKRLLEILLVLNTKFYTICINDLLGHFNSASPKFANMEVIVNKVAESGIITLNLEDFAPKDVVVFDLKEHLFMGLILKEKDFRAALQQLNWHEYLKKNVIITCSVDAIIPVWAYMLVSSYLSEVASAIKVGNEDTCKESFMLEAIQKMDATPYADKRIVIKGCGELPIPPSAYASITEKLKPWAKSIMYGEPCSTVPIYKKKTT